MHQDISSYKFQLLYLKIRNYPAFDKTALKIEDVDLISKFYQLVLHSHITNDENFDKCNFIFVLKIRVDGPKMRAEM